ncbi:MAG TPA: ribosome-associated translation inhibitor RaiA [Bdellovibrionota bacterium]|jgi:putative sigma-54 modulation protein
MQMEFVLKNTRTKGNEIKGFLEDKTSKIEKFVRGHLHARWTISYEADEHEAHLHITANNVDYMGKARNHNLFTAVEEAVDKVERQLAKRKEIIKDHKGRGAEAEAAALAMAANEEEEE